MPTGRKSTLEEAAAKLQKIQAHIDAGDTVEKAAGKEDVTRQWYYTTIERLERAGKKPSPMVRRPSQHPSKAPMSFTAQELVSQMEKIGKPDRTFVPLGTWNYLFLYGLSTEYGTTIAGAAAFLLSEKIREYAWRVPEVVKAVNTYMEKEEK